MDGFADKVGFILSVADLLRGDARPARPRRARSWTGRRREDLADYRPENGLTWGTSRSSSRVGGVPWGGSPRRSSRRGRGLSEAASTLPTVPVRESDLPEPLLRLRRSAVATGLLDLDGVTHGLLPSTQASAGLEVEHDGSHAGPGDPQAAG